MHASPIDRSSHINRQLGIMGHIPSTEYLPSHPTQEVAKIKLTPAFACDCARPVADDTHARARSLVFLPTRERHAQPTPPPLRFFMARLCWGGLGCARRHPSGRARAPGRSVADVAGGSWRGAGKEGKKGKKHSRRHDAASSSAARRPRLSPRTTTGWLAAPRRVGG